jgi:hypothetical protein
LSTGSAKIGALILDLSKRYGLYALAGAATSLYCYFWIESISRTDSHQNRMYLAALAILLVLVRIGKRWIDKKRETILTKTAIGIYSGILVCACTVGAFNYYQFDRRVVEGMDDYTDIAYYYLNTKYLEELGYFRFYAATLYADKEYKNRHATRIARYRDLRDYEIKPTAIAFYHGREIKEKHFTPERWRQFEHDIDWFLQRKTLRNLRSNFFVDHGYNPPPTWAVPGGVLAKLAPVESIKVIACVDVAFVVAMLVGIAWAFGLETMLFAMLFFLTTFSGRWPILSHSLLRFDWVSCLVLAVCMMKKERWTWAGALLAYAALNRIFPAIFFAPWLFCVLHDIWKERRIPGKHLRFIIGAAIVTIALVVAGLGMYGPDTFAESAKNLQMHNESYSSHRVGLGDVLVYEGETTRKELIQGGGIYPKELRVQDMQLMLRLIGIAALVFLALFVVRTKKPLHDITHLAVLPFYCVTNPQINYYNLRLVLVIWHVSNLNRPLHKLGLILLILWMAWGIFQSYRRTPAAAPGGRLDD